MQPTIDDFLDAMKGCAPRSVVAAVLAEMDNASSPLYSDLKGVEAWAKTSLPTVAKTEPWQLLPEGRDNGDASTALSFAPKARGERAKITVSPIIEDYVLYHQGAASKEVVARVVAALEDPESELCQVLKDASKQL